MTKYYDSDEEDFEESFEYEPAYNIDEYILRINDLLASYDTQTIVKITKYDGDIIYAVVHFSTDFEVRLKIDDPVMITMKSMRISEIRSTEIQYIKELESSKVSESPFEKPLEDK